MQKTAHYGAMQISKLALAALFVFTFSEAAGAASIVVANSSFEILPAGGLPNSCGAGCSFSTSAQGIPGWNVGFASGLVQPGFSGTFFDFVPDGATFAYTEDGAITQTTSATVQPGVTYTLLVDIGLRKDKSFIGTANLVIGGTTLVAATGVTPVSGGWSTFTATYVGLAGDVGKTIGI